VFFPQIKYVSVVSNHFGHVEIRLQIEKKSASYLYKKQSGGKMEKNKLGLSCAKFS
jgi:hypothetical protein